MNRNQTPRRVQVAASEQHRKHRAWWDRVIRAELSDGLVLDYLDQAKIQLRLKFAYQDYALMRWDTELLLSDQWIDDVSPEEFLDWVKWHPGPDWDAKVEAFLNSSDFLTQVHLVEARLDSDAQEELRYNMDLRFK